MGKGFKRFLGIMIVLLAVFVIDTSTAHARGSTGKGFFICAEETPNAIMEYAQETIYKRLVGYSSFYEMDIDSIIVGHPFTIEKEKEEDIDVYYFPIFENGKIILTYRVYFDTITDSYVGIMGDYLAEELNTFGGITSANEPLLLYMDNSNVCSLFGGNNAVIWEDPFGGMPLNVVHGKKAHNVINIIEPIEYVSTATTRASSSYLCELDMLESQKAEQWCAAFAASSILRYKGAGSTVTAKAMVSWAHPDTSETELPDVGISRAEIVKYAKELGYVSTTESSTTLSSSTVVSELSTYDTPIYAGCYGTGNYIKARHALVIAGYDDSSSAYTVWNPWRKSYETMPYDTLTYKVNSSSTFVWDVTIYKFRK